MPCLVPSHRQYGIAASQSASLLASFAPLSSAHAPSHQRPLPLTLVWCRKHTSAPTPARSTEMQDPTIHRPSHSRYPPPRPLRHWPCHHMHHTGTAIAAQHARRTCVSDLICDLDGHKQTLMHSASRLLSRPHLPLFTQTAFTSILPPGGSDQQGTYDAMASSYMHVVQAQVLPRVHDLRTPPRVQVLMSTVFPPLARQGLGPDMSARCWSTASRVKQMLVLVRSQGVPPSWKGAG